MSELYRFPALAELSEIKPSDQLSHISDEVSEAWQAHAMWLVSEDRVTRSAFEAIKARRAYGMELMDVIHAAETALRITFDDEEIDELRRAVAEKNAERGYYGE